MIKKSNFQFSSWCTNFLDVGAQWGRRSEDLFTDPATVWERLQAFLGLTPLPLRGALPWANAGEGEAAAVPEGLSQQLRQQLEPTYRAMAVDYGMHWP